MSPSPPDGLVENLRRLDPELRLRWGQHQHKWIIEVRARGERQEQWQQERPSPVGTSPRSLDWWEGWSSGFLHVTALAHPIAYPWSFIAAHLKHLSLEAHHAKGCASSSASTRPSERRRWRRSREMGYR